MKRLRIQVPKTTSRVQQVLDFCRTESIPVFSSSELQRGDLIGLGSFGKCYEAVITCTKTPVALKLPKEDSDHALYRKEVQLLHSLQHRNIVSLHGIFHSQTEYGLAMEYMELRIQDAFDLGDVDLTGSKCHNVAEFLGICRRLDVQHTIASSGVFDTIALDCTAGLAYLHEKNVVHRDMKTENVLITNCSNNLVCCKLCDFGEARSNMLKTRAVLTTHAQRRGTLVYNSPEQFGSSTHQDIDSLKKMDVWALGMVIFCLLNPTEIAPWMIDLADKQDAHEALRHLMETESLPTRNSEDMAAVKLENLERSYKHCISHKPSERATSAQVLAVLR